MTYFTLSAVAALLGTDRSSLCHHVRAGNLASPSHPRGKRFNYTSAEVEDIRRLWASRLPLGCSKFSVEDVARMRSMWEQGLR
jgi:hypothetical protein